MRRLLVVRTLVYGTQVKVAEGFEEAVTGTEFSTKDSQAALIG